MGHIGRNSVCTCGSGKKYKKCHGSIQSKSAMHNSIPFSRSKVQTMMRQVEAKEHQRTGQQGKGFPIVSFVSNSYRIVAVGNGIMWKEEAKWRTFHDFLMDFIAKTLGQDWGAEELKKYPLEMHPILKWHNCLIEVTKHPINNQNGINESMMTGAIAAYLGLSYNLYILAHNTKIQQALIKRLKDKRSFHGAYYETYVAASFIKAGFTLEFENEKDGSTSHCEFTATNIKTGKKFSVEAKARHVEGIMGDDVSKAPVDEPKVHRHLHKALKKRADHARVIFIDVNVPDDHNANTEVSWLKDAIQVVRKAENEIKIDGDFAPPAYVFLTNHPYEYELTSQGFRWGSIGEGFRIPDFKSDFPAVSLREVLDARERHQEMHDLMWSLKDHYSIPETFDGTLPEYTFGRSLGEQLIIGNRYLVPANKDGSEQEYGVLTSACVMENELKIYACYSLESNRNAIFTCPINEAELEAYKREPENFFGQHSPKVRNNDDPVSWFDWFFGIYKDTTKEKLLELMHGSSNFENLKNLSQKELCKLFCEGNVYSVLAQTKK